MVDNNLNNPALVSVIIPTYNCRKYIRQAIESSLAQTYKNIEIIVVDDGSTDKTEDEINDLISDKKISYIYQSNKGLPGARNSGIKNSKGEYLVFLDSDDIILPEKIIRQVDFMKGHPDVCIVYSNYQYFKNDNFDDMVSHNVPLRRGNLYKDLIKGNFIAVHSVLVRKRCVEKVGCFDESLRALEDWDLWVRMAETGCQFDYIDKILCRCRLRTESMSLDWDRIFKSWRQVLNKILTTSSMLTSDERFAVEYADIYKSWETIYYQLKSSDANQFPQEFPVAIKAIRKLYDLVPYDMRREKDIHKRGEALSSASNEIIESVMLVMDLYEKVFKFNKVIQEKDTIIKTQDMKIQRMMKSKIWKITAPFRKIEDYIKGLG